MNFLQDLQLLINKPNYYEKNIIISDFADKLLGIFTNQFLGITFGTLGCGGNGKVTAQVVTFTNENAEVLARDMAVGQGESLNVLAELMNIQSTDKARFFEVTKANFSQIYAADHNSAQVLASLQQVMANDAVLKAYV